MSASAPLPDQRPRALRPTPTPTHAHPPAASLTARCSSLARSSELLLKWVYESKKLFGTMPEPEDIFAMKGLIDSMMVGYDPKKDKVKIPKAPKAPKPPKEPKAPKAPKEPKAKKK